MNSFLRIQTFDKRRTQENIKCAETKYSVPKWERRWKKSAPPPTEGRKYIAPNPVDWICILEGKIQLTKVVPYRQLAHDPGGVPGLAGERSLEESSDDPDEEGDPEHHEGTTPGGGVGGVLWRASKVAGCIGGAR